MVLQLYDGEAACQPAHLLHRYDLNNIGCRNKDPHLSFTYFCKER
jgi:hypothetical protein